MNLNHGKIQTFWLGGFDCLAKTHKEGIKENMKIVKRQEDDIVGDLMFDLLTLIDSWTDASIQHENMAKLLKAENGKTDCMAKGLAINMKFCIRDLETILKKYKDEG